MAKIEVRSARTTLRHPGEAADQLLSGLGADKPRLAVVFASRDRDQRGLNRALRERLPRETRLVGATTGGEIDNAGIHQGSVVLGTIHGDVEVGVGLGKNLSEDAVSAGSEAIRRAAAELGTDPANLDTRRHVGLVIDDGFRYKKEACLLGVLERNQGLVIVGGGAADVERDPSKQSAELHVDGDVATDAMFVVLFRTQAPWAALREHPYEPLGESIVITRVDETGNRALEIDGKPAAERYSEICGVPPEELEFGTPNGFAKTSLALKVGREYFMRSPWKPLPDGSILFANLLEEYTQLELMRLGDMPSMTKRFFQEELPRRVKNPKGVLAFHCQGRYWLAQSRGVVDDLGRAFAAAPPCAGMNCHFETYCGFHINTTLTTLAFGSDP